MRIEASRRWGDVHFDGVLYMCIRSGTRGLGLVDLWLE